MPNLVFQKPLPRQKPSSTGHDDMGETFERLAGELVDKYLTPQIVLDTRVKNTKLLMKNMNMSLDEVLDALKIQGEERKAISEHIKS